MKIGILGTGDVGQQLGAALVKKGHDVMIGARSKGSEKGKAWAATAGAGASEGAFEDAAKHGEVVLNCVGGQHAEGALTQAGESALAGKILIDVSNPLDFSGGFPPTLSVGNDTSLAEQIQKAFPGTRVVKALNTVANEIMVDPGQLPEDTNLFICGEDDEAKRVVTEKLVEWFGWKAERVIDLGGIENARGTEAWLLLWTRLYRKLGTGAFNIKIVKAS